MLSARHTHRPHGRLSFLPLTAKRRIRAAGGYKPGENLVRKKVKQLLQDGIDQSHAQKLIATHKRKGRDQEAQWTTDPFSNPLIAENQSNFDIMSQIVLSDVFIIALAVTAYQFAETVPSFSGKESCMFILAAFAFATTLFGLYHLHMFVRVCWCQVRLYLVFSDMHDMIISVEALKEIARPASTDAVTKVHNAIDWYKAAQQEQGQDSSTTMTTAESLDVLFILGEAQEKQGFSQEDFGLSTADVDSLARLFTKYARAGDGRLHCSDLQQLCEAIGEELTEDEGNVALQALSNDGNEFIDFSEFVGFWVNGEPSGGPAEATAALQAPTTVSEQ